MGLDEEADRTLFIRNLDIRVTEELLFELFLQAGPLIKTKIPKDGDGKQKTFGFAVYKHEESVPYAMQLLNGTSLFGRMIHVQFRSGSTHSNSPVHSSPTSSTPNPHGLRMSPQFMSPQYTPPALTQRSFSSPDSLQKHAMMNMMCQQQQQLHQLSNDFSKSTPRHPSAGGAGSFRQRDSTPYRPHPSQANSCRRNQRYGDDTQGRHHHPQHRNNYHQQNAWGGGGGGGGRHYEGRGTSRHHEEISSNRGYQDSRWRRY
ncbi:RNA-binding protein 7 isoform X2 [Syngnathoides biaculeatus]|uniref:RNA-binding protein 7 isoform X2 n=1 Tax=Syngnathoides biaculeatus TaxID=300417 RepID=UPI002ADE665F|nr:RNA-binding protein 7 isoform X2 [Syngnathoides biaculeatus]